LSALAYGLNNSKRELNNKGIADKWPTKKKRDLGLSKASQLAIDAFLQPPPSLVANVATPEVDEAPRSVVLRCLPREGCSCDMFQFGRK
jgi:hypothetical protein